MYSTQSFEVKCLWRTWYILLWNSKAMRHNYSNKNVIYLLSHKHLKLERNFFGTFIRTARFVLRHIIQNNGALSCAKKKMISETFFMMRIKFDLLHFKIQSPLNWRKLFVLLTQLCGYLARNNRLNTQSWQKNEILVGDSQLWKNH